MRTRLQAAFLLLGTVFGISATPANAALVISKGPTQNVNCSAGVCNATAADAVLNVKDLANMLAASDVEVFAEGVATDITVSAPFRWVSANRLTLGAYGSLNVKDAITVAGTGGLTIATNVAGTDGTFRLVGIGKISFWDTNSSLIINNTTYTLVNNLPALISAVAANPSGTYAFANDYNAAQDGSYLHTPIPQIFTGIFEGLGNRISNFTIYNGTALDEEQIALFYELGSGGQISDVNLDDVSIEVWNGFAAPLVSINNGTVTHGFAGGTITRPDGGGWNLDAAGLIYQNNGTITRSSAAVDLLNAGYGAAGLVISNAGTISLSDASGYASAWDAGGLVEYNTGVIVDSYARGQVHGNFVAGGLVGALDTAGTIRQCFATGAVDGGWTYGDPNKIVHRIRKGAGAQVGGLVGASGGGIAYSYATGSVTGIQSPNSKPTMVGGLVGRAGSSATLQQSYSLGYVKLKGKFFGGVIGYHDAPQGNSDVFWDLDTSAVPDPSKGTGNIYQDPGLKGYDDAQFKKGALMRKFDPSVWAQSPGINNGYPYLIANPPPK